MSKGVELISTVKQFSRKPEVSLVGKRVYDFEERRDPGTKSS